MSSNPNFIVPIGTQVVCNVDVKNNAGEVLFAKGVVGIIVRSPVDNTHAYRVRFMDETELMLPRRDFIPRKQFQNPLDTANNVDENDLYQRVIYRCITGSRAYGLDNDQSDIDLRGIFLPPADLHWSLYGVPEQLENDERQECYWEIQKFILLALKANPNILECLYTPLVEYQTPLAAELINLREIFVSKMIYQTYNGYVMSQFKRLEHHLQNHGTIKWKHAMHLIRLLLSGILALHERYIPVRVEDHRDQLLAIRHGQLPWVEVNEWRVQLHKEFDAAFETTKLPDRPDYERANAFLVHARRSAFMTFDQRLYDVVAAQPYRLLFTTISGAHLYGFPSPDSDYDLRGSHILPVREVVSLNDSLETVDFSDMVDGLEIDLVTHDLAKYFNLLLKRNGYVLEQICSPLVIHTTPEFEELRALIPACITRHHVHHYLGFVKTEWRLFSKEQPHRVKPLLYVFRVLLTGIHLMKTGEVESNLVTLNTIYKLPYIPDLVARKLAGAEQSTLQDVDYTFFESEYNRLTMLLESAFNDSQLPEAPTAKPALNDLLIRLRLNNL